MISEACCTEPESEIVRAWQLVRWTQLEFQNSRETTCNVDFTVKNLL
jgi:hypothetical protein